MFRRVYFIALIVLSLGFLVAGCANTSPEPASAGTGTAVNQGQGAATPTPCNVFQQIALPTLETDLAQCAPSTASRHTITVSILPQKYFVERIGGDYVDVNVMVPPGASPATYEPTPVQLSALSKSELYFAIGVPFENAWLDRIAAANPAMPVVKTQDCIDRVPMTGEEGGVDPHIWLSPRLVKTQADTIYEALARIDCAHELEYKTNLESFLSDIDKLDTDIRDTLANVQSRTFMVFHPSWGYFARDYDLEMIAIEIGGQEPSAAELAHLIELAQSKNIKVVFAQPEFSIRAAETIANQIGGQVVLIDPLAPDWLDNMRQVAQAFARALNN